MKRYKVLAADLKIPVGTAKDFPVYHVTVAGRRRTCLPCSTTYHTIDFSIKHRRLRSVCCWQCRRYRQAEIYVGDYNVSNINSLRAICRLSTLLNCLANRTETWTPTNFAHEFKKKTTKYALVHVRVPRGRYIELKLFACA
jgi:hypothetical protein